MKLFVAVFLAAAAAASVLVASSLVSGSAEVGDASPIFGVRIPAGYRQWELIAPAEEAAAERAACSPRKCGRDHGLQGSDPAVSRRDHPGEARLETYPVAGIRARLGSRCSHDSADHGQGFQEIRGDGRLGIRSVHRRQTRR
jgi:hypothetical protein